jgi:hypothetical protein
MGVTHPFVSAKADDGDATLVRPSNWNAAHTPSAELYGAIADKEKSVGAPTSGDDADTGLTITSTPEADSYVAVFVNGIKALLGDGVKTKDCYFSNDGGTTARAITAIAAGDTLFWNGVISGHDLATDDVLAFMYPKS